jgi:hypothetical protein
VQLVGKHVDSTVNNPIEAVAQWRANSVRPLCVFDSKVLPYTDKVTADKAWADIPTCASQGLKTTYLMLRGFFMPPGATKDQVDYYVDLFKKVRETPEWKDLMKNGAFNQTFMVGDEYTKWVDTEEKRHQTLMKDAGSWRTNQLRKWRRQPPADQIRWRWRRSGRPYERSITRSRSRTVSTKRRSRGGWDCWVVRRSDHGGQP